MTFVSSRYSPFFVNSWPLCSRPSLVVQILVVQPRRFNSRTAGINDRLSAYSLKMAWTCPASSGLTTSRPPRGSTSYPRDATHPLPLPPRRRHFVARALGDHLPFELGEGQKDVEGQPSHRTAAIELLRHRHETHSVLLEDLDDASEIEERAGEPVHLINQNVVHRACLDVGQEAFERGPVHVGAGEPAVVIGVRHERPPLVLLAGDVSFRRFPLGVQGVELLGETFVGGLARVDGAPDDAPARRSVGVGGGRLLANPSC